MAEKNIHANHRKRLFHTVTTSGLDVISDHMVLEFLLTFIIPRKDTNPIAHALIDTFGSISGTLSASIEQLSQISGMGIQTSRILKTIPHVMQRYIMERAYKSITLDTFAETLTHVHNNIDTNNNQNYVLILDPNNKAVGMYYTAEHDLNKVNDLTSIINVKNANSVLITRGFEGRKKRMTKEHKENVNDFKDSLEPLKMNFIDYVETDKKAYYTYEDGYIYTINKNNTVTCWW